MTLSFLFTLIVVGFVVFKVMSKPVKSLSLQNTDAKYQYLCEFKAPDDQHYYVRVYSNSSKVSYQTLAIYITRQKSIIFETADEKRLLLDSSKLILLSFEVIDNTKEKQQNDDQQPKGGTA